MHENLIRLRDEALAELGTATDADALEAWRVRYLSRKGGALTTAMGVLGTLPREERPAYGQAANEVKNALEAAFAERQDAAEGRGADRRVGRGHGGHHPARPAAQRGPSARHDAKPAPALRGLRRDGLRGLRWTGCGDR